MQIREIISELFYEKTRIILTILAIAWGTFSIAIMLAIGEGLRVNFAKTMANAGNNLLTVSAGYTTKNYHGLPSNTKIKLTMHDVLSIKNIPNVISASAQYSFSADMRYREKKTTAMLFAVTPDYATIHNISLGAKERFINAVDVQNKSSVIVLGSMTAKLLFTNPDEAVGKIITLGDKLFLVVGVMQKKSELHTSSAPDSRLNWIPVTTYELLTNPQYVSNIAVYYANINLLEQTQKQIQKIIALNHAADPTDAAVVNFSDLAKDQQQVNKFFFGMQIFLGIVGSLTLLIAGVGIANVMYASVSRATREIGTRMALGATKWQILSHYIIESLVAAVIGGSIGIIITLLVIYLIRLIPLQGKLIDAIGKPEPVLSFSVLTVVIIILGLVGFFAGFFPARSAAKIDPAEALTYE
ncbi:MAG: ABC transporter permease [Gammaproteobacteria bacterium]|nr:ABC transporter permease [Gammaproteobacteria bacterium]